MLHAAVLRAGVPSGRITRIDVSSAARMPGVRAIVTAADAPGMNGIGIADHPLFAREPDPLRRRAARRDRGRYAGEATAPRRRRSSSRSSRCRRTSPWPRRSRRGPASPSRLARARGSARRRTREPATSPGRRPSSAATPIVAFARRRREVVESTFRVGRQNHVVASSRAPSSRATRTAATIIETSTQAPWTVRNATARLLGVPASQVRVTCRRVGGGFGQKFDCSPSSPSPPCSRRGQGRPVRLVYLARGGDADLPRPRERRDPHPLGRDRKTARSSAARPSC